MLEGRSAGRALRIHHGVHGFDESDQARLRIRSGRARREAEPLDKTVGAYNLALTVTARNTLSAFGYPAAGKYKGNDLTYCSGSLIKTHAPTPIATRWMTRGAWPAT